MQIHHDAMKDRNFMLHFLGEKLFNFVFIELRSISNSFFNTTLILLQNRQWEAKKCKFCSI